MYQVYALKCAERETTACQIFYREPSHEPISIHYYVWLILGGPFPVLMDTGFGEGDARMPGIRNYVSPAAMVERLGVKPEQVRIALISHLHWDHWSGHAFFPAAEFWVQREEVAFWTGPVARYDAYKQFTNPAALGQLVMLNYGGRIRLVEGEQEVLPGLRVHWVGGHTAGSQIVSADTPGGRVVISADAVLFYRNLERRQPVQQITSLPQMLAAFDMIEALAGRDGMIVAGHDPEVAKRFKLVEPGVIRVA
jgi:glyoxylase-like metal-dependent hydrolase (beta-lactamase superfamily II)